jgi:hypothetical protein
VAACRIPGVFLGFARKYFTWQRESDHSRLLESSCRPSSKYSSSAAETATARKMLRSYCIRTPWKRENDTLTLIGCALYLKERLHLDHDRDNRQNFNVRLSRKLISICPTRPFVLFYLRVLEQYISRRWPPWANTFNFVILMEIP